MRTITYKGAAYTCREGETVLDALLRQGVDIPFSCRGGVCHVCLHRSVDGRPSPASQKGFDHIQCARGDFLPCRCVPVEDMTICAVDKDGAVSEESTKERQNAAGPTIPDPEMWAALDEGRLLNEILNDFYSRVYIDPRLAPFFDGVTMQRAVEKQYLFLRQLFTGEKVYFGDRPRNAHHWMVISDELFDYREELMGACLERHQLSPHLIARWMTLEESFRADIVKAAPFNRIMNGIEIPAEGYGEAVLEIGSVCDGCGGEIEAGVMVRYHLRLGSTYCPHCCATGLPT